jgi:hypothetical protein
MAAFQELDIHRIWMSSKESNIEGLVTYEMPAKGKMCENESGLDCFWAVSQSVAFVDEDSERYWTTITAEECIVCSTTRMLDRLPPWTELLDTLVIEEIAYAS